MAKADCGNCRFYKDDGPDHFKEGYGKCRRQMPHTRTNDGKWCGLHQFVESKEGQSDG